MASAKKVLLAVKALIAIAVRPSSLSAKAFVPCAVLYVSGQGDRARLVGISARDAASQGTSVHQLMRD